MSWANAGLYLGYGKKGPTSGLKPPGMKEALGPNMEWNPNRTLNVTLTINISLTLTLDIITGANGPME